MKRMPLSNLRCLGNTTGGADAAQEKERTMDGQKITTNMSLLDDEAQMLLELAALRGLEPDKLLHSLALEWTSIGIGVRLAGARYPERMNRAHPKAFDCEAEAARPCKTYAPIDWGAADRPTPPRYAPIEWPAPVTTEGDV